MENIPKKDKVGKITTKKSKKSVPLAAISIQN
jgi:hypothetical protein